LNTFDQIEYSNYDIHRELLSRGDNRKLFNLFFDYNKKLQTTQQPANDRTPFSVVGLHPSRIVNRILSFRVTEYPANGKLDVRFRTAVFDKAFIKDLSFLYIESLAGLLEVTQVV
jgi:hypothetical protein